MAEQRRLAAILAADMVGYSRLMEADESGTIERQRTHRAELIDPKITEYNGRIVKTTGDGILVEFSSIVDAVKCAVFIQRTMTEQEADVSDDHRIQYRIGINLDDIVIDGDDILGDGVNVAARLEGLAEPGGICIPRKVFHAVRNKLDVGYAFIGEQKVKNIETPIPVYRILLEPDAAGQVEGEKWPNRSRWILGGIAAVVVAMITMGGLAWWQPWVERVEPASVEEMAHPLPEKPSIAVLPFTNMSADKEQVYFADGLTQDITNSLARFPNLFVIAQNSTNKFKGKAVDIRDVAHDLGVRYVLEGSIRRVGNTLRITAQLIDALRGNHVWANKYDRELRDVFALQDEITSEIGSRLVSTVATEEYRRRVRKGTQNPKAYDLFLRSRAVGTRFNPRDNATSIQLAEQSLELDPEFALAYAQLAFLRRNNAAFKWASGTKDTLSHAEKLANKAIKLDPRETEAYRMLSFVYQSQGRSKLAIEAAETAVSVSPSNPDPLIQLAYLHAFSGYGEDAVRYAEAALRLNPYPRWNYPFFAGFAYYVAGKFDKAVTAFEWARRLNPRTNVPISWSVAAYAQAGQFDKAQVARDELMKIKPGYSIKKRPANLTGMSVKTRELFVEGLRKAGVPEE